MIKVNPLKTEVSNGSTVFLEVTVLGNRYLTDEVGGGALVWDTAIVSKEALLTALVMELGPEEVQAMIRRMEDGTRTQPGA